MTRKNVGTGQCTNQSTRDYANELNTTGGKIDAGCIIAGILGGGIDRNNIVLLALYFSHIKIRFLRNVQNAFQP
ncbi:MAG: hypothetical protein LBC02_06215 [Planctomycetaceae bacterium]|nr:hypothetical protein [Planctomycetaceae bacterium]